MESDIGRSMLALWYFSTTSLKNNSLVKIHVCGLRSEILILKNSKLMVATAISVNVKKSKQAVSQDLLS